MLQMICKCHNEVVAERKSHADPWKLVIPNGHHTSLPNPYWPYPVKVIIRR